MTCHRYLTLDEFREELRKGDLRAFEVWKDSLHTDGIWDFPQTPITTTDLRSDNDEVSN